MYSLISYPFQLGLKPAHAINSLCAVHSCKAVVGVLQKQALSSRAKARAPDALGVPRKQAFPSPPHSPKYGLNIAWNRLTSLSFQLRSLIVLLSGAAALKILTYLHLDKVFYFKVLAGHYFWRQILLSVLEETLSVIFFQKKKSTVTYNSVADSVGHFSPFQSQS